MGKRLCMSIDRNGWKTKIHVYIKIGGEGETSGKEIEEVHDRYHLRSTSGFEEQKLIIIDERRFCSRS